MPSLVEELQKDALNQAVKLTELLQKSLVVATKLKLNEFASWVRLELDGYGETDRVLRKGKRTPEIYCFRIRSSFSTASLERGNHNVYNRPFQRT
ncbi:MAG: AbiTii domain-containing protein [Gammaproteobacteria bacterium]